MKKTTLLIVCLVGFVSFAQVNISENFDLGTPAGWTDSYSNSDELSCSGSSERVNLYSSNASANLTSANEVSASNFTDLNVSFDYKIVDYDNGTFGASDNPTAPGWGTADLQYSLDDGTTWTTILTIDDSNHTASASCAAVMATVPAASLPSGSDVKLQIINTWAAGDYFFYVDNFVAQQELGCVSPIGTAAFASEDCLAGTFSVDFDITDLGDGSPVLFDGTTSTPIAAVGMFTLSYPIGTPLSFTLQHGSSAACDVDLGTVSDTGLCPVFATVDCSTSTPVNTTFCYDDDADTRYVFTSIDGSALRVDFIEGYFEDCCDNITIYDGGEITDAVLFASDGSEGDDATGISAISTGDTVMVRMVSDGSVSCAAGSGSGIPLSFDVVCYIPSNDTPDYFNVQFPATATIEYGDEFLVFAQVYEAGLTDVSTTPAAGIEAWIGYSEVDSNPDTEADWTWVQASTNPGFDFSQNNDEYSLDLGAEIGATGTYYYASRWSLNTGPFVYGGILPDASNGGEWGTGGFASGVLTVNPPVGSDCSAPIDITSLPYGTSNDTAFYGDDYDNGDSPCNNNYMSGDDVFYTYTPSTDVLVDVSLSNLGGSWSGIHILDDCLDGAPNCVAFEGNSGSSDRILDGVLLNAGVTYYIIISTWASPQSTTYDLDISESSCQAVAGTLTADATSVELSAGTATISAAPNGDIVVPTDYEVTYVLTSGSTLIIEQVSDVAPSFDVTEAGDYTIHTLVAETSDSTDPNFLDLSVVNFGTTTGGDVLGIVTDAGLCASLDVTGAAITVLEECTADAGILTADATPVTLTGGTATISATEDAAPTVPTNYEVTYVLTFGPTLIIEDAGATPSFDVTEAGDYIIHTLVAETTDATDPNYVDLSVITFGTTTASDVLALLGTSGVTCVALDLTGAPITVEDEGLSIGEENDQAAFSYYPNPVKNTLKLNAQNNIENVEMYNMLGQVVLRATPNTLESDLDMSSLQTGTYFVKVTIESISKTIRVIKE